VALIAANCESVREENSRKRQPAYDNYQ